MQSMRERVRELTTELSKPTDSDVVHLRTLRIAIGVLGLALPWALAIGVAILVAIAAIAVDKMMLGSLWSGGTSFVFWMETAAVTAFGVAWLTKAEVILADHPTVRDAGVPGGELPSARVRSGSGARG